jgi:hypothetical protein
MITNSEGRIHPKDRAKLAAKREHARDIARAEKLRRCSFGPSPKIGPKVAR